MGPTKWAQSCWCWCMCCSETTGTYLWKAIPLHWPKTFIWHWTNCLWFFNVSWCNPKIVLVYVEIGFGVLWELFVILYTRNTSVDSSKQSNIYIYNFTKLGCNFNHSSPVTTHQLLQINRISHQDLPPTPTGMNFTLVKKLLENNDLNQKPQHTRLKPWT